MRQITGALYLSESEVSGARSACKLSPSSSLIPSNLLLTWKRPCRPDPNTDMKKTAVAIMRMTGTLTDQTQEHWPLSSVCY